VVTADAGWTSY